MKTVSLLSFLFLPLFHDFSTLEEVIVAHDISFSISKQKVSSKSSEKLIGFNVKEVLTYEFVIKNNKNEAARIELRDQLPLSVDKSVEVKALELSSASLDPINGLLKWNLDLEPNEIRRLRLSFSVKYPKSKRGILAHDKWKIVTPRYF